MESVSSFDTAGENFYHGFMLGLCALLGGFFVTSNRKSGEGRYDIQLKPLKKGLPGIIIELKAEKNSTDEHGYFKSCEDASEIHSQCFS